MTLERHAMPRTAARSLLIAARAGLILLAPASVALAQERVGVTGAVNQVATSTRPGASVRRLVLGHELIFNERITTAQAGQTQLLFLDGSAMTIGPNSDLLIDQFVYDPRAGTGKLVVN